MNVVGVDETSTPVLEVVVVLVYPTTRAELVAKKGDVVDVEDSTPYPLEPELDVDERLGPGYPGLEDVG